MEMVYDPKMQSDQWLIANCLIYFWWEDDDLIDKTTTMYWQLEERSRELALSTIAYIGEAALPLLEDIAENDESKSIKRNAKDWIRYVKHNKEK